MSLNKFLLEALSHSRQWPDGRREIITQVIRWEYWLQKFGETLAKPAYNTVTTELIFQEIARLLLAGRSVEDSLVQQRVSELVQIMLQASPDKMKIAWLGQQMRDLDAAMMCQAYGLRKQE
jgi:hypothetical protein